ncbi:MAG: glycosyltransferase family 1 protein [Cyclobacteriaceae bacterium]
MTVFFFQRKPFPNKNYSIEVLFNSIRAHLPSTLQYRIIISRYVNSGGLKKLYNILEILFKEQGDVNHITGDIHYIAFFMRKKRTILTIHDLNLLSSPSAIKRAIHRWFWLKIPVGRSQVVTVISQTTKAEVLKHSGCSPDKIRVIYNCISSAFKPHPKDFNKKEPVILQVGTKPNKNLSRVIQALEGIPCRLEIIGKPTDDDLRLLEKHTINYGWEVNLTDEQVVQKYIDCDMLVFVSTLEGFGLPIVEANAIERPVITSNLSSMPEIAGEAAHLVDPYSIAGIRAGVMKVIQDEPYRAQLIEKGKLNRQRFMPETIADAYAQLYQEVAQMY